MKLTMLSPEEVEDFWAMNVSIEAEYVPDDEITRALVEGRVQRGVALSSMGTAEAFWHRVGVNQDRELVRESCAVVPPGQRADETPFLERTESHDADVLWAPFRRGQIIRVAGALPDDRAPVAMAECLRILGALDARWHKMLRPRMQAVTVDDALRLVFDRIDELADDRLDKNVLRFEVLRTLVKIAWARPWQPVDVDAAWWE
jgi:hypothetical protein